MTNLRPIADVLAEYVGGRLPSRTKIEPGRLATVDSAFTISTG